MASPNISFDTIPAGIRVPGSYMEFNTRLAIQGVPTPDRTMLIVAQRLTPPSDWAATTAYSAGDKVKPTTPNGHYYICTSAGTSGASAPTWPTTHGATVSDGTVTWMEYAAADVTKAITTDYLLTSDDDARSVFGEGSQGHLMAKEAFDANPYVEFHGVAMADSGSNFASATVSITGVATSSGIIKLYICETLCEITFTLGDTNSEIAAALAAKINATRDLPVIASVSAGVVTLTCRNSGTLGNQNALELSYTQTASVTAVLSGSALAGGTTDPDLQTPLDAIVGQEYSVICPSLNDYGDEAAATQLLKLRTHLRTVTDSVNQHSSVGVFGFVGTVTNYQTLADTINDGRLSGFYLKQSRSPSYRLAAGYGARIAAHSDPALPYNGEEIAGIAPPTVANRLSWTTVNTMLNNGGTPGLVESGAVVISRAVTTYQSDESQLDITTVRTMHAVRYVLQTKFNAKYRQSKMYDNDTATRTATSKQVKSDLYAWLKQLENLGWVENVDTHKDKIVVEKDLQGSGQLNAKVPCDVVNGLHVFAARIDLIL